MRKLIIGIVMLANISLVYGQDETSPVKSFAFSPKLGMYGSITKQNYTSGLSFGLEANIKKKRMLFAADYYNFNEMAMFKKSEVLNQIGFLIGQQVGKRYFRFQYQIGPSIFWGQNPGYKSYKTTDSWGNVVYGHTYFTDYYSTIGAELKIGCHWLLTRHFSLGIDVHGNMNFEKSIFFPLISLEFGKLRGPINKNND